MFKKNCWKWLILAFIFLFVLVFNFLTPYIQDDYQLMFNHLGDERLNDLFDIFRELKYMYFNWGGRVFAHFFTYAFLLFPKCVFNIFNSFIYTCNIYLVYLIIKRKSDDNYLYLLFIHCVVFVFFPVFAQCFLWLDGSCNYSFTLFVQLLLIYKVLNIKNNKYFLNYFILGIFAGMCNENSSLSIIILIMYTIIDKSYLKIKISSLIGAIIGYLFLFLAPGNFCRIRYVGGNSFFDGFFVKLAYLLSISWPLLILLLIIIFTISRSHKGDAKQCLIFFFSAIISFFSMIASPQLSLRSFTLVFFYVLFIFMRFFYILDRRLKQIILCAIVIIFIYTTFVTCCEYFYYSNFNRKREKLILMAITHKQKKVKIKVYEQSDNCRIPISCELNDISLKYDGYPNIYMEKFYGIDKIVGYK